MFFVFKPTEKNTLTSGGLRSNHHPVIINIYTLEIWMHEWEFLIETDIQWIDENSVLRQCV